MNWHDYYQAPEPNNWQGREDAKSEEYFYQIIQLLELQHLGTASPGYVLLGFCCDEGVRRNLGRPGAAEGPNKIKQALARLPVHANLKLYDAGNIVCLNGDLEEAQAILGHVVDLLIQHKLIPIVLGGGHETAWGHYQGLAKHYADEPFTIINFDAHFDLRELLPTNHGTSGTPFRQIAQARRDANKPFHYACVGIQRYGNTKKLFQEADTLGVQYLMADKIHAEGYKVCNEFVLPFVENSQAIYVSICLDVFATQYAPGVSAPQTLGLTPHQVIPALRKLAESRKVVALDIVELAPAYDQDERTAKLAANLLSDFLHHL